MEKEAVQELPLSTFKAKYRSNTGFLFSSTIQAKTYEDAYKYAQYAVKYANKQKVGQRSAVVLSLVDVVRA